MKDDYLKTYYKILFYKKVLKLVEITICILVIIFLLSCAKEIYSIFARAEIITNAPTQRESYGYLIQKPILKTSNSKASSSTTTLRVGGGEVQIGKASWYDYQLKGYPNYSKTHLTCASRKYPRGTILNVRYKGKVIAVRVNDYGPESWTGRIIDLSSYAFSQLASLKIGVIVVEVWEY